MTEYLTDPRERMIRELLDLPDDTTPYVMALAYYQPGKKDPKVLITQPPLNQQISRIQLLKNYLNSLSRINENLFHVRRFISFELKKEEE